MRDIDEDELIRLVSEYPDIVDVGDIRDWLEKPENIALEKDGSFGLFTWDYDGLYCGHYFFRVRGKEAFDLATNMIDEIFSRGAKAIRGMTPIDNKPAVFMTRRLGFGDYGIIDTPRGPCHLFILNRKH